MTRLTALIAKLMRGQISRRSVSNRVCGLGFGMVTAESILDNIATGQERSVGTSSFQPFGEKTPYEQWMGREGVPFHTVCYIPTIRKSEHNAWEASGARAP